MKSERSRRDPHCGAQTRIVIMGAAGRDFHNFNQVYRHNSNVEVVAFTAAQISGIANRFYPPSLAGPLYPEGIPIVDETELDTLCQEKDIDQVIFAYSDVTHRQVMHLASRVLAGGADFLLLGPQQTMLTATVPVIAVSAVRTGCGKSQTSRWLSKLLQKKSFTVAVIRHPMPYGDLEKQAVQRFATLDDLTQANCTVEEREEYEPHINVGNIVYAGVDYEKIVQQAQQEADIILWDGGNNDFPFIRPDLHLVLVDPLRPGDETTHHPGEVVLRMADIVIIAKVDAAEDANIQKVKETAQQVNPQALIIQGKSPIVLDQPELIRDRRVLVVEDGPTTTHGGMAYGAGYIAATRAQAKEIVDPRPYAVPEIAKIYENYPHIGSVLPAMGYFPEQLKALETTINQAEVDVVVAATPSNLGELIEVNKPIIRASYEFAEAQSPGLTEQIEAFLEKV
ncbi:unknown [Crocosphaera subtropica ATCC 51142]|uniref:CobW/HypB/UreG nucleotide-binding domain-containing protein n=1 Tax=Crocosphaera subtropica (strain ATCC 51142 / BH68) TaxID=43989 RepID=B1X026_CROS5|nr:cyclic 2,3-diphosphoglycerate synthase [Crocosphaera subtropica]ACB49527.1 unknown [Crocosphaera subtropica ATCC 51142]